MSRIWDDIETILKSELDEERRIAALQQHADSLWRLQKKYLLTFIASLVLHPVGCFLTKVFGWGGNIFFLLAFIVVWVIVMIAIMLFMPLASARRSEIMMVWRLISELRNSHPTTKEVISKARKTQRPLIALLRDFHGECTDSLASGSYIKGTGRRYYMRPGALLRSNLARLRKSYAIVEATSHLDAREKHLVLPEYSLMLWKAQDWEGDIKQLINSADMCVFICKYISAGVLAEIEHLAITDKPFLFFITKEGSSVCSLEVIAKIQSLPNGIIYWYWNGPERVMPIDNNGKCYGNVKCYRWGSDEERDINMKTLQTEISLVLCRNTAKGE